MNIEEQESDKKRSQHARRSTRKSLAISRSIENLSKDGLLNKLKKKSTFVKRNHGSLDKIDTHN